MNAVKYYLRLNVQTNECQAKLYAKQFDNGTRALTAVFYTEDGTPYDMTGVAGATLYAVRPGGVTTLSAAATITSNNITLTIPSSVFITAGTVECELTLYDADSRQLTSPRFDIIVEDALYDENAVTATDDWTALTAALAEVQAAKAGLMIRGTYATLSALEAAVPDPRPCDTYAVGTAGAYEIYVYTADGEWTDVGAMNAQNAVLYGSAQSLSSSQKAQARSNIDAVPTSRTVNGKALSSNITLSASDVGAVSSAITTLNVIAASSSFTLNRGWAHKIGRVVYYSASITLGSSAVNAGGALVRFDDERPIASGGSQNYAGIGQYSGTAFSTGWNVTGTHPWMTVNSTIPANSNVFVSGSFITAT